MESKRIRAPNFNKYENGILLDLVDKYKRIIENKKTDGVTVKEKESTWRKIAEEFSRMPGVTERSHTSLKTAYENLKRKARRDAANDKVEQYKTGGGTLDSPKLDILGERLLGIIRNGNVALHNSYDSDAGYGEDYTNLEPCSSKDANRKDFSSKDDPLESLQSIADGNFHVTSDFEKDEDNSQPSDKTPKGNFHVISDFEQDEDVSQPSDKTPKRRCSNHTMISIQKKRKRQQKDSAAESIAKAAVAQEESFNRDMQLKEEQHHILMEIHRETLELLRLKKEIAKAKLEFWKTKKL